MLQHEIGLKKNPRKKEKVLDSNTRKIRVRSANPWNFSVDFISMDFCFSMDLYDRTPFQFEPENSNLVAQRKLSRVKKEINK